MAWLEGSDGKVVLKLWIQPRAAKAAIVGLHGDALKIKLTSPPIGGQANDQLIVVLSGWLNISASQITLRSGRSSRRKVLEITGVSAEEIKDRLGGT